MIVIFALRGWTQTCQRLLDDLLSMDTDSKRRSYYGVHSGMVMGEGKGSRPGLREKSRCNAAIAGT